MCGRRRLLCHFHRAARRKDGTWLYQNICKSCAKVKARVYYLENQERLKEYNRLKGQRYREENPQFDRAMKLKHKYGLTIEAWDRLHDLQLGRCAICRMPLTEAKRICVDHDHRTGLVRGLLCDVCNLGVGCFRDDPDRCLLAARYLAESRPQRGPERSRGEVMPHHGDSVSES
jgi:Recombination endonuclease VII